jgi:hypothetical protein
MIAHPRRFASRLLALMLVLTSGLSAQLVNTSVRVRAGTGDDTLITGFVVGAQPKTFLFRAVGPTLGTFGVSGVLADPILTLFGANSSVLATNNDWGTNPSYSAATITSVMSTAGAFPLPAGSRDAVLIATLPSGPYTVQVTGANNGTGVALFEAYEITAPPAAAGTISGRVTSAINGSTLGGATLRFRSESGVGSGTVVGTTTSAANGTYTISLAPGTYTAEVSLNGYITSFFSAISSVGNAPAAQNFPLSPVLGTNEFRIVLSWGATPADLDAHLTGPHATIAGARFHVFWDARSEAANTAKLDLDDTDQFGPETITITSFRPGVYRYSVHDFTNRLSTQNTALSSSGAQVVVFRGSAEVARFTAPTGRTGTLWTVFEIDGSTLVLTPRNEFSNIVEPLRVTAPALEGAVVPTTEAESLQISRKPKR